MNVRSFVPRPVKLGLQLARRFVRYRLLRRDIRFAAAVSAPHLPSRQTIHQPVRRSPGYENKLANLRRAARSVNQVLVAPGQTFSFWRAVGPPTKRKGYLPGRNLVGGQLRRSYGGGLCQLSGLLYHLSLTAGLDVIERHNHSVDIYTDDQRFTPLGADATVVYGYRNLLVRNNTAAPLRFRITVGDDGVVGELCCEAPLPERTIHFRRVSQTATDREVLTTDANGKILCRSVYKRK